jgi:hypothetical protein
MTSAQSPQLSGTVLLSQTALNSADTTVISFNECTIAPAVHLNWTVPLASVSGLSISSLQMKVDNYKYYRGMRNITKSGRIEVRTI